MACTYQETPVLLVNVPGPDYTATSSSSAPPGETPNFPVAPPLSSQGGLLLLRMLGDGSPAGHTRSLLALSDVLGAHNRITTSHLPSCIQGGLPSAGLWVGLGVLPRAPVAQGFCDGLGQRRLTTGARVQRHCSGSPGTRSHDPPAWFPHPCLPISPLSLWDPQTCPWHSPAQSLSVAPHGW